MLFAYPGLSPSRWVLQGDVEVAEIAVTSNLSTDSGDALRTWCLAGLGISLREMWVADDLREGRLVDIVPEWGEQASPISAVRAKREPVPRRIGAFVEFLAKEWRTPPWER